MNAPILRAFARPRAFGRESTGPTLELNVGEEPMPATPGPARTIVFAEPYSGISPTWLLLAFALGLLFSGLFR